ACGARAHLRLRRQSCAGRKPRLRIARPSRRRRRDRARHREDPLAVPNQQPSRGPYRAVPGRLAPLRIGYCGERGPGTRHAVGQARRIFVAGTRPHVLSFTPDGKHVYNGSLGIASPELPGSRSGPKQLTVADAKTLEVVRILPFERGVRPFAFTPNGSLLYVQFSDGDGFSEVNPVTGAILRTKRLPVVGPPSTDPNEAPHHGIAVSMDGKTHGDAAKLHDYSDAAH